MMRTVYLEGEMALKFGEKFEIFAKSPTEVFQCLELNFPSFRKYLFDCHEKNINFSCQLAENYMEDPRELFLNYGKGDMIISPVPAGSKGVGKVIAAIAIIVASIYIPGFKQFMYTIGEAGAITGFTLGGTIVMSATLMLANMGIAEMMAPDPSTDPDAAQDESYLFQGAGHAGAAGDPVPLLYGRLRVPGKPVSSNISNVRRKTLHNTDNTSATDPLKGQTVAVAGIDEAGDFRAENH